MEVAALAPNSEVTIYPWKDSQTHIDEVVEHASSRRTNPSEPSAKDGPGLTPQGDCMSEAAWNSQ